MKEIQEKVMELISGLGYEDQNTLLNNIRSESKEKRMKEIYFHEEKAAEIRRTMDRV